VVANLPDVLLTAYFMNVDIPENTGPGARKAACRINQYFYCLMALLGHTASDAARITRQVRAAYHLEPTYRCVKASVSKPCGYVTLPGALAIAAALAGQPPGSPIPSLDPSGPGSGLGANYITPEFAGRIQTVNDNVNAGIEASARATGAPLVDVRAIFQGVASGDPTNQYFAKAQVNPGVCCTEVFPYGGLVSFDGLHPSNTGYALISYYFIRTINNAYRAYGANVPETPIEAIYEGKPPYEFADPYAYP
ncbi:MAG TPA: SGNH/GDSL hydrolase family protein, partial [Candidatus Acidoferrales bacterium]|nr:SGNH/GDSL hydrolase family protein [Candidatus Acidoferrales bacterium]